MTEQNTTSSIIVDQPLTKQDWVTFRRFWRIASPYSRLLKLTLLSILILTFPLTVYFNITLPFFKQVTETGWTMDLTPIFVHGAILFVLFFRNFNSPKNEYQKNIHLILAQRHMEFGQTSLKYSSVSMTTKMKMTREYRDLKNVFETKNYLYILDFRALRLILKKDSLSAADLSSLRTRLQNAIGKNYILVK